MDEPATLAAKKAAGRVAVDTLVESGMRVGLGTGSTAVHAICRVAERVATGELRDLEIVSTSTHTMTECWRLGLSLRTLNDPIVGGRLDVVIDGADEVDDEFAMIKGGGAALLMEKVVAAAGDRFAVVVDESKLVRHLGFRSPVPVEVAPAAVVVSISRLERLGYHATLRQAVRKAGPVVTDNGNFVLDVTVGEVADPVTLERQLSLVPGLLANGIFVGLATDLFVGTDRGDVEHRTRSKS